MGVSAKKLFVLLLLFSLLPGIGFAQDAIKKMAIAGAVVLAAEDVTEEVEKIDLEDAEKSFVPEKEEETVKEVKKPVPRFSFEPGILAGLLGGATGIFAEVRIPLPLIIGPAATSFRVVGGIAQSEDTSRRYAPVQLDFILNFPPGWFTGVENYLGFGPNYVVRTTGKKSGQIGGEVFYGVESDGFGGKVYGEMGYGFLRTGFTSDHEGVSVLVGHRRRFSF
jgi:hypothetical protein